MIQADAMYTASDLRKLGIGDVEITRARRAGAKPVTVSNRHWYYGRDLIAWMRSKDSASDGTSNRTDSGHEAHFSQEVGNVGVGAKG